MAAWIETVGDWHMWLRRDAITKILISQPGGRWEVSAMAGGILEPVYEGSREECEQFAKELMEP